MCMVIVLECTVLLKDQGRLCNNKEWWVYEILLLSINNNRLYALYNISYFYISLYLNYNELQKFIYFIRFLYFTSGLLKLQYVRYNIIILFTFIRL